MKVELSGERNSHKLLLDGHDISNGVTGVEVAVYAGAVTEVTIIAAATSELISEDADVYIKFEDKKFKVIEVK